VLSIDFEIPFKPGSVPFVVTGLAVKLLRVIEFGAILPASIPLGPIVTLVDEFIFKTIFPAASSMDIPLETKPKNIRSQGNELEPKSPAFAIGFPLIFLGTRFVVKASFNELWCFAGIMVPVVAEGIELVPIK
jgi:hypothetical protein